MTTSDAMVHLAWVNRISELMFDVALRRIAIGVAPNLGLALAIVVMRDWRMALAIDICGARVVGY